MIAEFAIWVLQGQQDSRRDVTLAHQHFSVEGLCCGVYVLGFMGVGQCEDLRDVVKAVKCCLGWLKLRWKLCSAWQINCVIPPHLAPWHPRRIEIY
jgi:hypothetical protein